MNNQTSLMKSLMDFNTGVIEEARKDRLRAELETHIIDTCKATDTNTWETGIEPTGNSWVIVEQYEDKKEATKGHKKWVASLKKNPKQELEDVMEYGF